ncbi:hypothetical protein LEP1GSC125_1761 [Leptospira mayottensis 200901122]|uniref:Uncharacterized protein n=1 Tax=Leptospira mayottensis 200901122 TaxID=1193010 RepID=A0AA87MN25_9LEPT|nr:hypothetical protein LEP1GSC125_1761 [Leptospira mayottensis 200901122]
MLYWFAAQRHIRISFRTLVPQEFSLLRIQFRSSCKKNKSYTRPLILTPNLLI